MATDAIYLDYNSTTPVDPEVLEVMLPWLQERFGNSASQHGYGRVASSAVDTAREQVSGLLGCSSSEVVFTSGATEANNLALKGAFESAQLGRNRVVVAATEHKSILEVATWLLAHGARIDLAPVGRDGVIDLDALDELMGSDVVLVSVMLANNETGVVSPIPQVSELAHRAGALVHTDATQASGKISIDVRALDVDLASVSAHKVYGPQGVGALYVRRRTPLAPNLHGGGHERGFRSGTLNVPGIAGFGAAARIACDRLAVDAERLSDLVSTLHATLVEHYPDAERVAFSPSMPPPVILPNTLNVRFPGADAEAVLANAPRVAASTGSACTSLVPSPSHVLLAMLGDHEAASECIRFSLGRNTTEKDVTKAGMEVGKAALRVSQLAQNQTGLAFSPRSRGLEV